MKGICKLTSLAVCSAVLTGVFTGCSEKSTVQPSKGAYGSDAQTYSSDDQNNDYNGILDNVTDSNETGKVYSQTIMVYMVGSDLESRYGAATTDLSEMEKAMPAENSNLVVCAGGASKWQNSLISESEQSILQFNNGSFSVIDTIDSNNMGESESLSNFITLCMENYDTDLYSLILWDHGAGPVLGYGVDENYGDILTLTEMKDSLENSVGKTGKKLEWIGFDACLMSSMELCDAFEPYANYMIASQETEPGWGWNYEFLSKLSEPDMDGAHLGKEIIDSYISYGEKVFEAKPNAYADLTLSCLDLRKYSQAEAALNTFFEETSTALSIETFPQAVQGRCSAKEFGSYSSSYNYCLVDAVNLIENLASKNSASKDSVIAALRDMTVYMRSNVENAGGVSICYPYEAESNYTKYCIELDTSIDFADKYVKYLNDFYSIRNGETISSDWNISDAESSVHDIATPISEPEEEDDLSDDEQATSAPAISSGKDITLKLTDEQKKNFGSATYYILCKAKEGGFLNDINDEREDDMYIFIHGGKNVKMDNAGVLHAYYNNNVVYMKDKTTGELSNIPMVLIDNDSSSKEKRYLCSVVLTYIGEEISDWKTEAANLQIVVDNEHPDGEIRSAVPIIPEDKVQRANKQLLSLEDYSTMAVAGTCNYITRDKNGNLLPFFNWDRSEWIFGFEQNLSEDYALEVTSINNPENYVCMFVVTDSQGNASVSELIPLK